MAYQGVEDYPSKQPQPQPQPYAQQPQYNAMAPVPQQTWAFDTFSCLQDTDECLDVWCCHYCKFGYIGHRLERGFPGFDAGYCCGACCADACFYGAGTVVVTYMQRERIVRRYGIIEDGCTTFMLSLCCAACAICQQAREMKHRGECVGGVCVPAAPQPLSTMGGGPVAGQPVYPQQQPQPQQQQQPRPQQHPQAPAQQGYPAAYGQNAQGYPAAGYQQQPQPQGGVYAQPAQYYS